MQSAHLLNSADRLDAPGVENDILICTQLAPFHQPHFFSKTKIEIFLPREFGLGAFEHAEMREWIRPTIQTLTPMQGGGGLQVRRYAQLSLQHVLTKYSQVNEEHWPEVDQIVRDCLFEVGGAWVDWIRTESMRFSREIFHSSNLLALDSRRIGHFRQIEREFQEMIEDCRQLTQLENFMIASQRGPLTDFVGCLARTLSEGAEVVGRSMALAMEAAKRRGDQVYVSALQRIWDQVEKLETLFDSQNSARVDFHSRKIVDWTQIAGLRRTRWEVQTRAAGLEKTNFVDLDQSGPFRILKWEFCRNLFWPAGSREAGRELRTGFQVNLSGIRHRLQLSWGRPVCEIHIRIETESINRNKPLRWIERWNGNIAGARRVQSQTYRCEFSATGLSVNTPIKHFK